MKVTEHFLLAVALAAVVAAPVTAQPEPWLHPDGTMHYYDAVSTPGGITWQGAEDSAMARGGYLTTLTTQAENDFVFGLIDSTRYWYQRPSGLLAGPWLGGIRRPPAHTGWRWVSSESLNWSNWSPGEPGNWNGGQDAINFGETAGARVTTWNDLSDTEGLVRGWVNELSARATTIGLLQNDSKAFPGYTLLAPLLSSQTYLIDNKGRLIHTWRSDYRGAGVATLPSFSFRRPAGGSKSGTGTPISSGDSTTRTATIARTTTPSSSLAAMS
jgi:hypothetical protein